MADENQARSFICARCKKIVPLPTTTGASGYALRDGVDGWICYDCCALYDKEDMRKDGRITLYVSETNDSKGLPNSRYIVTNWPGTLRFDVIRDKETKHNWRIVGKVLHVWFVFEGDVWYGRHAGGFNNIVRCRRTMKKA